jgi:hypothetical protein
MILPIKQPYLCSFSQNSIDFGVKTNLLYQSSMALPFLKLDFLIKPTLGDFFRIEFTNPETAELMTIDFVAVDGSDPLNYSELWQIPDTSFSGNLRDLRNIFYEKLRKRAIVNAWFNIELPIVEFGGSVPWVRLTAKEARTELTMNFTSNQNTAPTKRISEELSAAYYLPWERDGYQLKASLYVETAYNSQNFELITAIDAVPDKDGVAYVDVSKYLNDAIESGWDEYPVPFEQTNGYKAQNLRKYYVEFAETFTGESNVFTWKSDVFFVHWGGTNADDQYSGDMVARINESGQYLTWWPSGKRLKKNQDDWLAYMNGPTTTTFDVVAAVVGDEEEQVTAHEAITLQPFETFVWNTGFEANNLASALPEFEHLRNWKWGIDFVDESAPSNQFTYYLEPSCFTQTILFFNAFGVPETFLLSGEFQQNLSTSKELATRTQYYALTNLLPQNYIFDVSNVISYQAQTMALTNHEAERLMPLLNSAIAFLQKNNAWQPIIIGAASSAIFKVNKFLQNISIELVAANEQKSISFFENKPDFDVIFNGGIQAAKLKRNGSRITDFGSVVATRLDNGANLGTLTYVPNSVFYQTNTPITYEGLVKMTLTTEVNNVEVITSKVTRYSWDLLEMVFFATSENLTFSIGWQTFQNTAFRIDYGDGTVDTGTITNTISSQDHTFATAGKKIIRLFCPNFGNFILFQLLDGGNLFDFGKFTNLQNLAIYNGTGGKYYLTTPNYVIINFQNTPLQGLNIGFQRRITALTLADTSINSDALDALLTEIWNFRKGYVNAWDVYLVNLGYTISDYADDIINGTGQFAGDGLVDNGIDVNIS